MIAWCTPLIIILALAAAVLLTWLGKGYRHWFLVPEDGMFGTVGPFWTRHGAIQARRRLLAVSGVSYQMVRM